MLALVIQTGTRNRCWLALNPTQALDEPNDQRAWQFRFLSCLARANRLTVHPPLPSRSGETRRSSSRGQLVKGAAVSCEPRQHGVSKLPAHEMRTTALQSPTSPLSISSDAATAMKTADRSGGFAVYRLTRRPVTASEAPCRIAAILGSSYI